MGPLLSEVSIKIQICSVFAHLMDLRQDFLIDNALAFFQESFV
jgi:inositol 1,4,5-triphosphate receptor type 3